MRCNGTARFLLFTRFPRPGEAKTRLVPALGAAGAAQLQDEMTHHVLGACRQAKAIAGAASPRRTVAVEVRLAGGTAAQGRRWLGASCREQGSGDLGQRIERAFSETFMRSSAGVAAVLGGDCPQLTGKLLDDALYAASKEGAALIPAVDGGYCLLALRRDAAPKLSHLFTGIAWGSEQVADQQRELLKRAGIACAEFAALQDIDTPEDLSVWQDVKRRWYGPPKSVSVIMPVLNERTSIDEALAWRCGICEDSRSTVDLRTAPYPAPELVSVDPHTVPDPVSELAPHVLADPPVEVIVVDGGSTDGTAEYLKTASNVRVLHAPPGRATQMNVGAAAATGDALLFVHADTQLPSNFADAVATALASPSCALGAFDFAFSEQSATLDLFAAGTRARNRLLHSPYGDQAFFCRRAFFEAVGGFPQRPMEDLHFMRIARRCATPLIVPHRIHTSARRYLAEGPWRRMLSNRLSVARTLIFGKDKR